MAGFWTDWGVNEWVSVGSALSAVLSLVFNWAVVRRQTALQFESLKAQTDSEIMKWAHEAIDVTSEAIALCKGRGAVFGEQEMRQHSLGLSHKLSSLADRGRLFFPNVDHDRHGLEREAAFRGFRPTILDCVVFACIQVDRLDPRNLGPDDDAAEFLTKCRRLLVSEVQGAVDPRRRGRMMRQLSKGGSGALAQAGFKESAALAEGLRARYGEIGVGARGPDWVERRVRGASAR